MTATDPTTGFWTLYDGTTDTMVNIRTCSPSELRAWEQACSEALDYEGLARIYMLHPDWLAGTDEADVSGWARLAAIATVARNAAMILAREQGDSLRSIAGRAAMSVEGVRRITG